MSIDGKELWKSVTCLRVSKATILAYQCPCVVAGEPSKLKNRFIELTKKKK